MQKAGWDWLILQQGIGSGKFNRHGFVKPQLKQKRSQGSFLFKLITLLNLTANATHD